MAIPEAIPKVLTCPIDQWHEETVELEVPVLRLKLLDLSGKALPNQDYSESADDEPTPLTPPGMRKRE